MIIDLAFSASDAMLNALARELDGGAIELLGSTGQVLATLRLSTPVAPAASGGELKFDRIAQDIAANSGNATSARIVGAFGGEVLICDVGDEDSDAVIKLTPQHITRGAPVKIDSFRLLMP
jgi:hypothetical protein